MGGRGWGGVAVCGLKEIKGDSHRKTDRSGSLRRITRSKDIHLKKNRRHCQRSTHTMSPPIPLNPTHTHTHTASGHLLHSVSIINYRFRSKTGETRYERGTNNSCSFTVCVLVELSVCSFRDAPLVVNEPRPAAEGQSQIEPKNQSANTTPIDIGQKCPSRRYR